MKYECDHSEGLNIVKDKKGRQVILHGIESVYFVYTCCICAKFQFEEFEYKETVDEYEDDCFGL